MVVEELRSRSDVAVEDTWDLSAIYPTREAWEQALESTRAELPKLTAMQGKLGDGAGRLLEGLRLQDEIGEQLIRAYSYAGLKKDEDNANAQAVADHDRAIGLSVEAGQAAAWFEPELLSLPEGTVERYLTEEPGLEQYRHALENLLRQRAHVLSAEQEQLLASAGEVLMAPGQIFTMLNNADLEYGTIEGEDGNNITITKGNYLRLMESRNRPVRQAAFAAMHDAYIQHRNTLATTYASSVKTDIFEAKTRKYGSALEASLSSTNIPVSVYDNLVETVNRKLPLLHRYIALRKRTLGLDQLETWDLYVPIVPEIEGEYTYERAVELVLSALGPLGDDYRQALSAGFDSRWVDVYENKGKTSGAYSWGVYGVHPFMLLNWSGRLNDVFTLGHEVGHAMHSWYTSANQPYTYGRYTLFVAEVASTVNELLMTDAMRRQTDDAATQMYLINHALEDFRSTLFRQTMFAEFERWAHARVEDGQALTPDALSEHYAELCRRYYGPDVNVGEHTAIEWARIPHFYRAFYVYQYATGISAAAALSRMLIDEGAPARDRYLRFLSSGSSRYSLDLLKEAGVDMTTPEPIEKALDVFDDLLTELERLMDENAQ
jgi:oligoendopeptidase F